MTTRVQGYILVDGKRTWVDITVENDRKKIQVTPYSSVDVDDGVLKTGVTEHIGKADLTIWNGGTKKYELADGESKTVAILNIVPGFSRWLQAERQKTGAERL